MGEEQMRKQVSANQIVKALSKDPVLLAAVKKLLNALPAASTAPPGNVVSSSGWITVLMDESMKHCGWSLWFNRRSADRYVAQKGSMPGISLAGPYQCGVSDEVQRLLMQKGDLVGQGDSPPVGMPICKNHVQWGG